MLLWNILCNYVITCYMYVMPSNQSQVEHFGGIAFLFSMWYIATVTYYPILCIISFVPGSPCYCILHSTFINYLLLQSQMQTVDGSAV